MKDVLKVTTVNFQAKWGDKEWNLHRIKAYIEAAVAEGSNLIVFPEMALTGYDDEEDKQKPDKMQTKEAEVVPGPASEAVAELTKKYGVYVAFGMPERDKDDPTVIYNSACVCGPKGIIGAYRKIHLPYPEMHWATRGEKPMIFETEWGPIGIAICYDSYCFPELMRYYAAKGCRIHINCTANARCHGDFLARTTIEAWATINNIYIVSSNLVGIDSYNDFWGGSSIVGPSTRLITCDYYAGYPFADPRGIQNAVYSATIDLALAKRKIFEPNPLINGATDFRPVIYKEMLEDLLQNRKFHKTEIAGGI